MAVPGSRVDLAHDVIHPPEDVPATRAAPRHQAREAAGQVDDKQDDDHQAPPRDGTVEGDTHLPTSCELDAHTAAFQATRDQPPQATEEGLTPDGGALRFHEWAAILWAENLKRVAAMTVHQQA